MKKILLILSSFIFLASCKKDNLKSFKKEFAGSWEMRNFYGYPFNFPTLPPGNGKIIVIGIDGSFERRSHDTIIFKGSYNLEERKDCYGDEKRIFFSTTDPSFSSGFIEVSGDTLDISSSNCLMDGGTSRYRRN